MAETRSGSVRSMGSPGAPRNAQVNMCIDNVLVIG